MHTSFFFLPLLLVSKFTSLPFVFALWAHNNLDTTQINNLKECIDYGLNNYDNSIKLIIEKRGSDFFSSEIITNYIKGFNYELTKPENNAITTFKEMYNKLNNIYSNNS